MGDLTTAAQNKMAAINGIVLGVAYVVFTLLSYIMVSSFLTYMGVKVLGYALSFVVMGMLLSRIKKANGGYLEFKEAFGRIFIMVLVGELIYLLFNAIYVTMIDPHFAEKLRDSSLAFMEHMKLPDAELDKKTQQMNEMIEESKHFSFLKNLWAYLGSALTDCVFGLLVALAVRKERPAMMNAGQP
jgi:Protein of unknown function (DUF4199)